MSVNASNYNRICFIVKNVPVNVPANVPAKVLGLKIHKKKSNDQNKILFIHKPCANLTRYFFFLSTHARTFLPKTEDE